MASETVFSIIVSTLILSFLVIFYFYVLGDTSSNYFCPALEEISSLLMMTPTLVGVTLLPLGNGAPDVFAAFASFGRASGSGEESDSNSDTGSGSEVGLSSILGAGVFVTSVVVGIVNIASPNITLEALSFRRDILSYGAGSAIISIIVLVGKGIATRAEGVGVGVAMLVMYALYGGVVVIMEWYMSGDRGDNKDEMAMQLIDPSDDRSGLTDDDIYIPFAANDTIGNFSNTRNATSRSASNPLASLPQWQYIRNTQREIFESSNLQFPMELRPDRPLWGYVESESNRWRQFRRNLINGLSIIWHVILFALVQLPREITIPRLPHDEDHASGSNGKLKRIHAAVSSFGFPLFLSWTIGIFDSESDPSSGHDTATLPRWSIVIFISCIISILATLSMPWNGSEPTTKLIRAPWVFGTFAGAILWIYVVANELVAALIALGVIFKIRSDILGLTVLAWGNSIGDALSNITIARGNGSDSNDSVSASSGTMMAIAGCYAGPLFNLLVGLGGSFLIASAQGPFSMQVDVISVGVAATFLILNVGIAAGMITSNENKTSQNLGFVLIAMYAIFLAVSLAFLFF